MLNGIKKVLKYVPARSIERKNAAIIIKKQLSEQTKVGGRAKISPGGR